MISVMPLFRDFHFAHPTALECPLTSLTPYVWTVLLEGLDSLSMFP